MKRLRWILAGVAAPLLMAGQALADFTYSVAVSPTSVTFGVGNSSSISFTPVVTNAIQSTANGATPGISLATVTVTDTDIVAPNGPAVTEQTTFGVTFTVTLTPSPTTGQTYQFTITGNLTEKTTASYNSQLGGTVYSQQAIFTPTISPVTPGGVFTAFNFTTSAPTVNSPNTGAVGVSIQQVPEPSSVALAGVGALLLVAPRLRRFARRLAAKS